MQKELLKVALIGVGSVGKKYARMITAGEVPHMKLSAVVIRRDELIEWGESLVNADGDNARIFRSAEELFETGDSCYDAVIIATPHKTHKELALKAFAKFSNNCAYGSDAFSNCIVSSANVIFCLELTSSFLIYSHTSLCFVIVRVSSSRRILAFVPIISSRSSWQASPVDSINVCLL